MAEPSALSAGASRAGARARTRTVLPRYSMLCMLLLLACHAGQAFGTLSVQVPYHIILKGPAPANITNNTLPTGYLALPLEGCSVKGPAKLVRPSLITHQSGPPSQWRLTRYPGYADERNAFTITSVGYANGLCPAILSGDNRACGTGNLKMLGLPSDLSIWLLEPCPSCGKDMYHIKLKSLLGKKQCKSYLGVPSSCPKKPSTCVPKLYGANTSSVDMAWHITPAELGFPPKPISQSGLDYNVGKNYLYAQNAQSAIIQPSTGHGRDLQITLQQVSQNTLWFTDKPFHETGDMQTSVFIEEFPWALGNPNAVIQGQSPPAGQSVQFTVILSSPTFNATTRTITYLATKLSAAPSGSFNLTNINVAIDGPLEDLGYKVLDFGGQAVFNYAANEATGQGASFQSTGITDILNQLSTVETQVQDITQQLNGFMVQLTSINSQVTTLTNTMQSFGSIYIDAFNANQSIADDVWNSGPASVPAQPIGSDLSCPDSNYPSWLYNILASSNNLNQALTWLTNAINGASPSTSLQAYLFNQAGQDCSPSGCTFPYTGSNATGASGIAVASPWDMLVQSLNGYVGVQLQGLGVCNVAAQYANTSSCPIPYPLSYCTDNSPGLNAQALLTDLMNDLTNFLNYTYIGGWPAYMWRSYYMTEPTVSMGIGSQTSLYVDIGDTVMAPAGQVLTSVRLNVASPWGGNWIIVEAAFASVTGSTTSGVGIDFGAAGAWVSNTSSLSGSSEDLQYFDLNPVILPDGYVAVGAALTSWSCSNLAGYTVYDYVNDMGCHESSKSTTTGTGIVLGLVLYGAQVSFDSTGAMVLGPISAFSNNGYCSNTNLASAAVNTNIWSVSAPDTSAQAYYPAPIPYQSTPTSTSPTLSFLQLFTAYNTGCTSGCSGSNVCGMQLETTSSMPAPGFVSGASIWLKSTRISVGVFTTPETLI